MTKEWTVAKLAEFIKQYRPDHDGGVDIGHKALAEEIVRLQAELEQVKAELEEDDVRQRLKEIRESWQVDTIRIQEFQRQLEQAKKRINELERRDGIILVEDGATWKARTESLESQLAERTRERDDIKESWNLVAEALGRVEGWLAERPGDTVARAIKELRSRAEKAEAVE